MSTANVKPTKENLDPVVLRVAFVLVVGALAPLFDSTMVNVAIHTWANLSFSTFLYMDISRSPTMGSPTIFPAESTNRVVG
jgi:hypothetical protein